MYYEVYLDSIFLICFCMNRYLLGLTALSLSCTATHVRLWLGAGVGAAGEVLVFFIPADWIPVRMMLLAGSLYAMEGIAFRCWIGKGMFRICENMMACFFLLGGMVLLLFRLLPDQNTYLSSGAGVLLIGALCYEGIRQLILHRQRKEEDCRVTLHSEDGSSIQVKGLIDTGNSLIEPISGRPVAVLERKIWEKLYPREAPPGMRVIPYHSVGKPAGILSGYPMDDMEIEVGGVRHLCQNIYVAIMQEKLSETGAYDILLQPAMLKEPASGKVRKKGQDKKYDMESIYTCRDSLMGTAQGEGKEST